MEHQNTITTLPGIRLQPRGYASIDREFEYLESILRPQYSTSTMSHSDEITVSGNRRDHKEQCDYESRKPSGAESGGCFTDAQ